MGWSGQQQIAGAFTQEEADYVGAAPSYGEAKARIAGAQRTPNPPGAAPATTAPPRPMTGEDER
jgi:hypothetical protein